MRIYATVAAAVLSLVAGSCADAPTKPQAGALSPDQAVTKSDPKPAQAARLLSNMHVEFPIEGGGTFVGKLTITRFGVRENADGTRQLLVTGELSGRAMKADGGIMKTADGRPAVIPAGKAVTITDVPATLRGGDDASSAIVRPAQATACDILFLDLGPIHLDLLGLVLDIAPIVIDLDAEPGPGNLLGNLLCALLGIFDAPGAIAAVIQLLGSINGLLSGVGGTPAA